MDAALPATSAYALTLDSYIEADGSVICETVVTGSPGYTLTADDFACFRLEKLYKKGSSDFISPDGYGLYLDKAANAIKLCAGIGLPNISVGGEGLVKPE